MNWKSIVVVIFFASASLRVIPVCSQVPASEGESRNQFNAPEASHNRQVPVLNAQHQQLPDWLVVNRNLRYIPNSNNSAQTLDLYLPKRDGSAANSPLPTIIFVHGGGWQTGNKYGNPKMFMELVRNGFALASINYRLSGEAIFPAQIYDVKAAIRWLRAHTQEYNLGSG